MRSSILMLVAFAATSGHAATRVTAPPALGEVHFKFDSSVLPADASVRLRHAVAYAIAHPSVRLVLDGHCDPRGTDPYNIGLAIRRAESVRDRLTDLGVPNAQIVEAIYGEDGARRPTYAGDRRVTVWASRTSMARVIARTFRGEGTAVVWEKPLTNAEIEAAPGPIASR
jgi:OmpA family